MVTWVGVAVEVSGWVRVWGGGFASLVSPLVGQLNKQLGTRPGFSMQRHRAPAMQTPVSGLDFRPRTACRQ